MTTTQLIFVILWIVKVVIVEKLFSPRIQITRNKDVYLFWTWDYKRRDVYLFTL